MRGDDGIPDIASPPRWRLVSPRQQAHREIDGMVAAPVRRRRRRPDSKTGVPLFRLVCLKGRPSLLRLSVKGEPRVSKLLFVKHHGCNSSQWQLLRQKLAQASEESILSSAVLERLFLSDQRAGSAIQRIFGRFRSCKQDDLSLVQLFLQPSWRGVSLADVLLGNTRAANQHTKGGGGGASHMMPLEAPPGILSEREALECFVCGFAEQSHRQVQTGSSYPSLLDLLLEAEARPGGLSPLRLLLLPHRDGKQALIWHFVQSKTATATFSRRNVRQRLLSLLFHGELVEGESSLARLLVAPMWQYDVGGGSSSSVPKERNSLLQLLLQGEEQGVPSLLRVLFEEFSHAGPEQRKAFLLPGKWLQRTLVEKLDLVCPERAANVVRHAKKILLSAQQVGLLALLQSVSELGSEILFELLFESHAERRGLESDVRMPKVKHASQLTILKTAVFGNGKSVQPLHTLVVIPDDNGLHPYPIIAAAGIIAGLRVKEFPPSQHFPRLRWWQSQLVRKLLLPLRTVHRESQWCLYLKSVATALDHGGVWESAFLGVANAVASADLAAKEWFVHFCASLFQESHAYDSHREMWNSHWDSVVQFIEGDPELAQEGTKFVSLFQALRDQDWGKLADSSFELEIVDPFSFATLFHDLEALLTHFVENLVCLLNE